MIQQRSLPLLVPVCGSNRSDGAYRGRQVRVCRASVPPSIVVTGLPRPIVIGETLLGDLTSRVAVEVILLANSPKPVATLCQARWLVRSFISHIGRRIVTFCGRMYVHVG